MKTNLICILFCVVILSDLIGQTERQMVFPTKFFSLKQAQIAIGIGADLGLDNSTKDFGKYKVDSTFLSGMRIPIAFDIYAPNSFLGFQFGVGLRSNSFVLTDKSNSKIQTKFIFDNLTLPFYLKLRPGNHLKRHHFLALLGGSYNISSTVKQIDMSSQNTIEISKPLKNFFTPELSLGYELSLGKKAIQLESKPDDDVLTRKLAEKTEFCRFYFYVRLSQLNNDIFKPDFNILGMNPSAAWNYKNTQIYIGFSAYFRLLRFSDKNL